jgi:flagellar biosynthesis regulator FlbT
VLQILYERYQVTLLAIESLIEVDIVHPKPPSTPKRQSKTVIQKVLLNPASDKRIKAGNRAYIIALNPILSSAMNQMKSISSVRCGCCRRSHINTTRY